MTNHSTDETLLRVLVLAPFGRDAALLTRVLNLAEIQAEACSDIAHLCESVKCGAGAVLVAEEALTETGMRLMTDCVASQEPWSDLPIFVMAQSAPERRIHLPNLEPLGNITVLERPLRSATLVSAFRMGLRARLHQYQLRNRLEGELRALQALRESEKRYRTLAEAMPQLVWTCDGDGRCDYLSRQWLEYTGIPEEQQLGFGWLNSVYPADAEQAATAWAAAYRSGEPYDVEFRLRRADGEYRWFKTRSVPVKDAVGKALRWFGSCTDIQDQKRISEERRELLIREQKARGLAELLNRVGPMLLEELDSERLAQNVTDLATELTGSEGGALLYKTKQNGGERFTPLAQSGNIGASLGNMPVPQRVAQGTMVSDDVSQDASFLEEGFGHAGALTIRSYLAAPLISRSGEAMGALVFGSSMTGVFKELHAKVAEGIAAQAAIALDNARLFSEAQRAQETLRRSNADLRRANGDLNQFAYSASHDLQEPLRMIALYSQMLDRKYRPVLDSTGAEYLDFMVQGARRMELLLRDLLDYTQVVSGQDEKPEQVDAGSVFQGVVQNLSKVIAESGAVVTSTELPRLGVKSVHLLQLLQNLVGNALKYRGDQKPVITVSARPEGQMWLLSVSDNGIGIAAQYTQQIFGLFRRLHGSSQYEGTGIGLAICQKIVERYGGRIWVQSEGEGKGCTFWFTLPGVNQRGM